MLPEGDFRQYNCLKHAILSGVNQIDTGLIYRAHRSERVVGAVLQTVIKKYGMNRAEIYITSKQGYVGHDGVDLVPSPVLVKEICKETGMTEKDFILPAAISIDPRFLKYSLHRSL